MSKHGTAADTSDAVDTFMAALDHPAKAEIALLRTLIVGADASIHEGIKWNAPSYRTTEYFATTHLRAKTGVSIILHLGAKVRASSLPREAIADPSGLLTWLGKDRASVTFADAKEIRAKKAAFVAIVRDWIQHV